MAIPYRPNEPHVSQSVEAVELEIRLTSCNAMLTLVRNRVKASSTSHEILMFNHDCDHHGVAPFWEIEDRAIKLLNRQLKSSLAAYSTSLDDDRFRLQAEMVQNIHNAVLSRLGEKEVLTFYLGLCLTCFDRFSLLGLKVRQL